MTDTDTTPPDSAYRIQIDNYSGPLDLLLYLIRREEVDIYDIPVARITQQYLQYMDMLTELNVNVAGEFVVMAATLIEIKSRMMAPQPEVADEEEDLEDPRMELVRQLMEYKRFKEAAVALGERAERRAQRFTRVGESVDDDGRRVMPAPGGLELWTLLDAFSRLLEQTGRRGPHRVVLDQIPQERLQEELEARLRAAGRISFFALFEGPPDRARMIGLFLALLELVRLQVLRVEQDAPFAEIWLTYVPEDERPVFEEPEPVPEEQAPLEAPPDEDDYAWPADDEDTDTFDVPDPADLDDESDERMAVIEMPDEPDEEHGLPDDEPTDVDLPAADMPGDADDHNAMEDLPHVP